MTEVILMVAGRARPGRLRAGHEGEHDMNMTPNLLLQPPTHWQMSEGVVFAAVATVAKSEGPHPDCLQFRDWLLEGVLPVNFFSVGADLVLSFCIESQVISFLPLHTLQTLGF